MSLQYIDIINGIQSLRRQAELKQCPVLGAAGIRAFCYPHQLYVVREVLSDTKIRRLLADEVGLGKTIEALMIMNALRIRNNYELRVSIVVGSEERAKQWRNEICGRFPYPFWKDDILDNGIVRDNKILNLRSNMNVFFDVTGEENHKDAIAEYPEDGFKIIFPQSFDSNKKYLEPERNDLLILDEIHSFSEALLNFLLSRSAEYQNVLVLSATPLLGDEKSRLQLLKLLNPDQAELSDLIGESPQLESIQILRSRRLDFPKALPQRKPEIRRFEPLENDIKRINKSGNLLREMLENDAIEEENATLFARRATVGGQTLIDRIDDYRNTNRYPEFERYANKLTELRTLCTAEQGDARLDELLDYLLEFFAEDNNRKIIIAAQDNPTIDYLTKQIRRCLTEVNQKQPNQKFDILQLRQERRSRDNNENENDQDEKKIQKNNRSIVEQFWNDKHQILIAHNDARESYNLQIADALVFYSLPWKAIDMEQWLGRISRLGLRKPKTVEIIAIVLRDTIDEKIADIYQSLDMFEHPLDLEKNKSIFQEIEKTIRQTVLGDQQTDVKRFINRLHLEDKIEESNLLQIVLEKEAQYIDNKVQDDVVQPVIQKKLPTKNYKRIFPKEDALDAWINLLRQQQYLYINRYKDDNYNNTQHPNYYCFNVMDKPRNSRISIPFLEEDPIGTKPFIIKRNQIQIPPRDLAPITDKRYRIKQRYEVPFQFFNFGSQLHDSFINHFAKIFAYHRMYSCDVSFNTEQFENEIQEGEYLIGILTTQRKQLPHPNMLDKLQKSENKTQEEMRLAEQRRLETGLTADDRFLDLLFAGSLEIYGFIKNNDDKYDKITDKNIYSLLTKIPIKNSTIQRLSIPDKTSNHCIQLAQETTKKRWQVDYQKIQVDYQKILDNRINSLQEELNIRERVLNFKISDTQRKIDEETNEQTIRLNYEPVKKRLEEQILIVKNFFNLRKEYLIDSITARNQAECCCKAVLKLNVRINNSSNNYTTLTNNFGDTRR